MGAIVSSDSSEDVRKRCSVFVAVMITYKNVQICLSQIKEKKSAPHVGSLGFLVLFIPQSLETAVSESEDGKKVIYTVKILYMCIYFDTFC